MELRYCPKKCIICGKWFSPNKAQQICCSVDCRMIRNKQMTKKRKELMPPKEKKKIGRPRKPKKLTLEEISVMARQEGLTYGQFVAKEYMRSLGQNA